MAIRERGRDADRARLPGPESGDIDGGPTSDDALWLFLVAVVQVGAAVAS